MYDHWGCTSNYRTLSYPFRSLILPPPLFLFKFDGFKCPRVYNGYKSIVYTMVVRYAWGPWEERDIGLFITLVPIYFHFLIRILNNFLYFYSILIGLFIKFSVKTFQPLILIYKRGNFV